MKKVLIVATTSYAGMGPYVSGIVMGHRTKRFFSDWRK